MEIVHKHTLWSLGSRQHGVTLIELMVGIALVAILMATAAPNFQGMTASSRLTSVSNDLLGSLQLARSQAIRSGSRVTVCRSTDGTQCNTNAAIGWNRGWIVFQDTTRSNANAEVDVGENIIANINGLATGLTIVGSMPISAYVSFAADGRSRLMGGGIQSGTIRVCSSANSLTNDNRARDLILSSTGQVIVTRPAGVTPDCPAA